MMTKLYEAKEQNRLGFVRIPRILMNRFKHAIDSNFLIVQAEVEGKYVKITAYSPGFSRWQGGDVPEYRIISDSAENIIIARVELVEAPTQNQLLV